MTPTFDWRWVLGLLLLGSMAAYIWAIRTHFRRDGGIDKKMQVLQLAGTVSAASQLLGIVWGDELSPLRALCSIFLYLTGLAVFFAAVSASREFRLTLAFSSDVPQALLKTGIFVRVRHPFYSAYLTTWTAGFVAVPALATGLPVCIMLGLYLMAVHQEESKFMNSSLAEEYREYRRGAGMFWPL